MVVSSKIHTSPHQKGSAALLTTIAISSILVVLFVGITTIATREIRQSVSSDQSSRALYAAEAGVEDAVRRLSEDPYFVENSCNEESSGQEVAVGDNSNAAWTCRTVRRTNTVVEGRLNKDSSMQINLGQAQDENGNAVRPRYMMLQWNKPGFDSATPTNTATVADSYLPKYLTASDWNFAAVMEMTLVWFPRSGGSLSGRTLSGTFPVRSVLASPINANSASGVGDFSSWSSTGLNSGVTTKCTPSSGTYNCASPWNADPANPAISKTIDLNNLARAQIASPDNYGQVISTQCDLAAAGPSSGCSGVIRIRPRYASANFTVRLFYDAGSGSLREAFVPDGYATIDVTARSSNFYRRVVAKKPISATTYDGVFDNALFSGRDICKTMKVYKDGRGAPDYIQVPDAGAPSGYRLDPNDDAGKNVGCAAGDPDV